MKNINQQSYKALLGATILSSAFLLFQIQPIFARYITPRLGGSSNVWITSMMLFQVFLLVGYVYALLLSRSTYGEVIHRGVLLTSLLILPINPSLTLSGQNPLVSILITFISTVALPYAVLASTSPLIQKTAYVTSVKKNVFTYFSISNAASLVGLISYPFIIEPYITLENQAFIWSIAYAAFVVFSLLVSFGKKKKTKSIANKEQKIPTKKKVEWIALSAIPAALFLTTTQFLTQDIASIPFIWIIPLSIYLVSFSLAFMGKFIKNNHIMAAFLFLATTSYLYILSVSINAQAVELIIAANSGLLIISYILHLELYKNRPSAIQLEEFYVYVAVGGAIGGFIVSIVLPILLSLNIDTHLVLLVSIIIIGLRWRREVISKNKIINLFIKASIGAGYVLIACFLGYLIFDKKIDNTIYLNRNFYGPISIEQTEYEKRTRSLFNGNINHGYQFIESEMELLPTSYYGKQSGVGVLLENNNKPKKIAAIGLGVGTIAAHGATDDIIDFYEINPAVTDVATHYFTYLEKSHARTSVIHGDARIELEKKQHNEYDLIIVDAFTSDAIPLHLLTTEAFQVYQNNLAQHGKIAVHISNRYVDLKTPVANTAYAKGYATYQVINAPIPEIGVEFSEWLIIGNEDDLKVNIEKITDNDTINSARYVPPNDENAWTDSFHSIFPYMKR